LLSRSLSSHFGCKDSKEIENLRKITRKPCKMGDFVDAWAGKMITNKKHAAFRLFALFGIFRSGLFAGCF